MGEIPDGRQEALAELAGALVREIYGKEPIFGRGSTDCNIPLSLGIPAISVGVYVGGGTHTREEWVEKASMVPGLEFGIAITLAASDAE
jgi:di/tripeptidase